MELNQIEAFVAVVQMKSFTRATHVLYLSQPAISRRIQLLEEELGVKLFERVHEGVTMTEAGQAFLPHAQRVLADVQDGVEAVRSTFEQAQATVKLAMVGTLANMDFTERLIRFRGQHPAVRLQLRTARSSEVSDFVRSGTVHLGLRYFEDPDAELISRKVSEEPLVVASAIHREWENPNRVDIAELQDIAWLSFPLGHGSSGEPYARLQAQLLRDHGLDDVERVYVDSLTAQKRLIEADFGIGLLPISSIQEELRLGTLKILSIPALETTAPIMLLYRREGYLNPAAQTLIDELLVTSEVDGG